MANSADPDQLPSSEATDLDLHYLQKQGISGFSRTGVKSNFLRKKKKNSCGILSFNVFIVGYCASGWIRNDYLCYNIETRQKMTWMAAKSYCNSLGAKLLKITG